MKTFKCSQCEFETARKDSLKRHIESIHENMKTFKCSQCEYETSRKYKIIIGGWRGEWPQTFYILIIFYCYYDLD